VTLNKFEAATITHHSSAYGFSWSTAEPAAAVSAATCRQSRRNQSMSDAMRLTQALTAPYLTV